MAQSQEPVTSQTFCCILIQFKNSIWLIKTNFTSKSWRWEVSNTTSKPTQIIYSTHSNIQCSVVSATADVIQHINTQV